ncbi:MAG: endonuclease III [Bifidobacterium tibiigranuli]|uniref:endonuclease III n=1 Tax=Bifidobacterium tibiigranuli TaxID=2172043 RepID=UPI0026ED5EB6|nr:endonuclease III [Bifidobacterium tibiigranuli]MCI1673003.1 endonuclease III [Bifidobacterium tibiigranuli]MCI1713103.1 endonuclease III [Bifidobacterium tibiigranuli]MCI1834667.1 endonuclease III [Bifidobacterium tibiigranuli]
MPRESKRALHARMQEEYALLCEEIPEPKCALDFSTPLQLLIATVLSAQTTDKRVNTVTPILFSEYPSAADLAAASPERVEDIIHPLGFYHSKSAHIIALADQLQERFDGVVPQRMEELVTLPGVGRKTANVVLGNAFGVPGFPVDTHVMRVTGRLRWRSDWRSTHPDPVRIEREITACFPPEEWTDLSHRLILHGRAICHARKPDCANCPLNATCPSSEV